MTPAGRPASRSIPQARLRGFASPSRLRRLGLSVTIAGARAVLTGNTRVVCNPKGYGPVRSGGRFENPEFDAGLILEI